MGRGDPLDHPELREIERLLDGLELDEAQRRLARAGQQADRADAAAYLATRLLFLRGKLDLNGVVQRLREILRRAGYFPRAAMLLHEAETGHLQAPADRPARPTNPDVTPDGDPSGPPTERHGPRFERGRNAPDIDTSASRNADWPPLPSVPPAPAADSRREPDPAHAAGARPKAAEATKPPIAAVASKRSPLPAAGKRPMRKIRTYTPIGGFDALSNAPPPDTTKAPDFDAVNPPIPRAPAVPQFESNRQAPSYEPEPIPEFDALRQKSLLPSGAGRYSAAAEALERSDSVRPRRNAAGQAKAASPEHARADPEQPDAMPSPVELASWIDGGQHVRAIAAINRAGAAVSPDLALLRARALAGAGYPEQAYEALVKLESHSNLEADLRAGCARLYVELGEPERALDQAIRALDQEPERAVIRLTFSLAAVRCSRRRRERTLLEQADRMLETLKSPAGPYSALAQALKACVQADSGDPEKAISIAQRALGLDSQSIDALAAIAEASARLGRPHDARQAFNRLVDIAPEEAEALVARLAERGVHVADPEPPSEEVRRLRGSLWPAAELSLLSGERRAAINALERLADEHVARMSKADSQNSLTAIAMAASTFLTTSPIFRAFAPFDASLHSVPRLEAALDVLYGFDRTPPGSVDRTPIVLLVGSYLGETLRLAHAGRWEGKLAALSDVRVVAGPAAFSPFQMISSRIQNGRRAALGVVLASVLTKRGGDGWRTRIANPVAPPAPWDPRPWPRTNEMERIGKAVPRSVISQYCELYSHGSLDRSMPSLTALEAYVALLSPPDAPQEPDASWMRRTAVLLGAYVGEVLRVSAGAQWLTSTNQPTHAEDYRLVLRNDQQVAPVSTALRRLGGQSQETLFEWARRIARDVGRG